MDKSFREKLLDLPCLGVWERDERLFCAPEIKWSVVSPHSLFEALDVAIHVTIQQFEKETEVFGIALVRGRCHQ